MGLRSLGALGAVLVIVCGGCGGGDEPRPDLVFVSTRGGEYAIYEMDADGSAQRRLSPEKGDASSPARLFFQIEPAWSPDASRIAFASRRTGNFDIYAMSAEGTGTRRLTSTKDNDTHPTWSATGDRIAFARNEDVWVMNADGSGAKSASDPSAEEASPAWSPDGAWIAYVRREPGTATREIWLMRPDGSRRHRLTPQTNTAATPAWSPDSRRIVFSSNEEGPTYELFAIGVDGKDLRRVVPTTEDDFEPSWSPDGTKIAYQEAGAIFTVELSDGKVEKLTDSEDNDSSPAWNPVLPRG